MKKTAEIVGLPIVSISDGMEVGKVKSIIINADKGAIDFIVVESGIQILGARVISTENILGIGDNALTIENENTINDLSKIPAAIDLLQKNISVIGNKVLTKKGRIIGEIGDIYVDEDDCCKIVALEYIADITQKKVRIIPRNSVITFGKTLVVVNEDVESSMLDSISQLKSTLSPKVFEFEKKNTINNSSNSTLDESFFQHNPIIHSNITKDLSYNENTNSEKDTNNELPIEELEHTLVFADKIEELEEANNNLSTKENPLENNGNSNFSNAQTIASTLFEQKQRQFLIGRRATKTIVDSNGNVIINEGAKINEEIIDTAKESGKLIELVMNNKA